eukprot:3649056-Prymnesium_polylepis.2
MPMRASNFSLVGSTVLTAKLSSCVTASESAESMSSNFSAATAALTARPISASKDLFLLMDAARLVTAEAHTQEGASGMGKRNVLSAREGGVRDGG